MSDANGELAELLGSRATSTNIAVLDTAGIEYFFEWSLNPCNSAFQDIRRGMVDVARLSDKCYNYLHKSGMSVEQVCLYSNQNDSILYQEMLAYKAGEATFDLVSPRDFLKDEDDSDWEYLTGVDHYDAGSELSMSTPSYYSDYHSRSQSPVGNVFPTRKAAADDADFEDVKLQIIGDFQLNGLLDPDCVEVGFYTPKRFSFPDMNVQVVPDNSDSVFPMSSEKQNHQPPSHPIKRPASSSTKADTHATPNPPETDPSSKQPRHLLHVTSLGVQGLAHSCEALPISSDHSEIGDQAPTDDTDYYTPMQLERSDSNSFGRAQSPPYTMNAKSDTEPKEYLDDDTILFTRRSVSGRGGNRADPKRSWLNSTAVGGAAATTEVVEFLTPQSTLRRSSSLQLKRDSSHSPVSRSIPVSAITHSQALDGQIQELVKRIVDGQGLPWPKPAGLKKLATNEKTRVMVLRHLEVELGIRTPDDLRMATSPQIAVVGVSKQVFKGLLELFKFLLQCVEEDLQKEPEGPIFSIFLILRIAFCIHLKMKQEVSPSSFLALGALRVSSLSISSTSASPAAVEHPQQPQLDSSQEDLALQEEDITAGKGGSCKDGSHRKEPIERLTANDKGRDCSADKQSNENVGELSPDSNDTDIAETSEQNSALTTPTPSLSVEENSAKPPSREFSSSPDGTSLQTTDAVCDISISPLDSNRTSSMTPVADSGLTSTRDAKSQEPLETNDKLEGKISPSIPVETMNNLSTSSRSLTPPQSDASASSGKKIEQEDSLRRELLTAHSAGSSPVMQRKSNLTQSLRANSKSPVLPRKQLHHSKSENFVPHILALSPRFLQHIEGRDLKRSTFLYKELMKSLGSSKAFMLKKQFWNVLFMSTVSTDRNALGWNEKTEELYTRYQSLSAAHQRAFGFEEDNLLSVLLHNLLVYMLMVGLSQQETTGLIHRFTARTRLATVEEKLLQQTLKHVELTTSSEVDLSDLGLMALHSEVHPTISYIVHYGVNMVAPVYKLQITDEALILRRFPDEKVSSRLWNDCITDFTLNETRSTLSVRYRDSHGEFSHHFHTKQFKKVFESLQEIFASTQA